MPTSCCREREMSRSNDCRPPQWIWSLMRVILLLLRMLVAMTIVGCRDCDRWRWVDWVALLALFRDTADRTAINVLAYITILGSFFFTALHGMQTRSSDENSVSLSVRPSVCLSVTRMNCDKTVERYVQIYIPYERSFSLVFWEEKWLVGTTLSTWNFGSTDPRCSDFQPIFARSSSAVTVFYFWRKL